MFGVKSGTFQSIISTTSIDNQTQFFKNTTSNNNQMNVSDKLHGTHYMSNDNPSTSLSGAGHLPVLCPEYHI
jgi:hypothetical protein